MRMICKIQSTLDALGFKSHHVKVFDSTRQDPKLERSQALRMGGGYCCGGRSGDRMERNLCQIARPRLAVHEEFLRYAPTVVDELKKFWVNPTASGTAVGPTLERELKHKGAANGDMSYFAELIDYVEIAS
jgi:hypothetical protein